MDSSIQRIADYACSLRFSDLPVAVVGHCKRRVLDTFGCAISAFDAPPSRIARALARRATVPGGARVWGTNHRTLPELAAFANGVMARYIEGSDAYLGGAGHPSDVIAPVLAAADARGADGATVITAVTLAYEVYINLFKAAGVRNKGLDHVYYAAVGSAVGAAKVLRLDHGQTANAVALAITPNLPLHATRRGNLSMWKGCAGANAARNGLFAALLAAEGMTGPDQAIEGSHGLRELLGEFELGPFAGNGRPFEVTQSHLKFFLSEYHAQAPIMAALELYGQVKADAIETVTIYTYWYAWSEIGGEPEKWHPTTREAADHSLPFIIAAVLTDGRFSDDIFSAERLQDPRIRALMKRIAVREDPELSRQFPRLVPCRIEVATKGGERKVAAVEYPRGHVKNPMTDDEVKAKFFGLAGRVLPQQQVERAFDRLSRLDEAETIGPILESVQIGTE